MPKIKIATLLKMKEITESKTFKDYLQKIKDEAVKEYKESDESELDFVRKNLDTETEKGHSEINEAEQEKAKEEFIKQIEE